MVKKTPSKSWYKKALKLEENLDVSAGPDFIPIGFRIKIWETEYIKPIVD